MQASALGILLAVSLGAATVDVLAILEDESRRASSVLGRLVLQRRQDGVASLQTREAVAAGAECGLPGHQHGLRDGPSQLGVAEPHPDQVAAGAVLGVDVRVAGMEETQVVDKHHVARLRVQTVVVLGCQGRKNLEGLELRRVQSGDRGLLAGLCGCGVKAQSTRVHADQDLVLGDVQQRRNDVARRVARPGY